MSDSTPPRWRRRAGCALLALALAASGLPLRAQNTALPAAASLGDTASETLDINDEARLGAADHAQIRRDPAYLDDPVLLAYLASICRSAGRDGAAQRPHRRRHRPALLLAFFPGARPGRQRLRAARRPVGVHLGLIAMTEHADELASVLAHELSHVTQRHIARSIGDAQRTGMVGIAAMLIGLVLAARGGSPDMAQAAVVGGQAAMLQGQLNYSRDMEREADRIGFGLLVGTGMPQGHGGDVRACPWPTGSTTAAVFPICAATR